LAKLVDLRTNLFYRADWAPTQSAEQKTRANTFLNDALQRLVKDAPYAFWEREFKFTTRDDAEMEDTSDTISQAQNADDYDPWVVIRDQANSALDSASLWPTDGRWRGRMLIVKNGNFWYEHRIRDVFNRTWTSAEGGDDATHQYISLFEPVPIESGVAASRYSAETWYIIDKQYWMPPELVRVNSIRLHRQSEMWPLRPLTQPQAEKLSLKDTPNIVSKGRPRSFFKWDRMEMPTPTTAPSITAQASSWTDEGDSAGTPAEPPGEFEYCYTYCWGYRNARQGQPSPVNITSTGAPSFGASVAHSGLIPEPLWESEPSPVTAFVALVSPSNGDLGDGALLALPDVNGMHGFNVGAIGANVATVREGKGGWRIRLYRRRKTTVLGLEAGGSARTYTFSAPEVNDKFYFIAEMDPTGASTFLDNGEYPPDYFRPLKRNNGCQGYGLYPRPDNSYELIVRAIMRWEPLINDTDAPPVHEDADEAIIDYALFLMAQAEGQHEAAQAAYGRYMRDHLPALRNTYGPDTPGDTILTRVPARARQQNRSLRKWWDTSTD